MTRCERVLMDGGWGLALIVLAFVLLYWLVVEYLKESGVLSRYDITAYGPILMIRTKRGQGLLEALARPRRAWRVYAEAGVPLMVLSMLVMTGLLLFFDFLLMTNPPKPTAVQEPRNILLIPGINEFIPLGYGLVALFVALVVHEMSHAVLCRVEGIRVKSMGILTLIVPIGGFAEPDESQLFEEKGEGGKVATRKERIRILTAGVMSNFTIALITFVLFFASLHAIAPTGYSAMIVGVDEASSAHRALVPEEAVILAVNGVPTHTPVQVVEEVARVPSGGSVVLTVLKNGRVANYTVPMKEGAVVSTRGLSIQGIVKDSPAERAGLEKGMRITAMDGVPIGGLGDFARFMESTVPHQKVDVEINGTEHYTVQLAPAPDNASMGFLGVYYSATEVVGSAMGIKIAGFPASEYLTGLRNLPFHLDEPMGWLTLLTLPIMKGITGVGGFAGFTGVLSDLYQPVGVASMLGGLWFVLVSVLFWIGWVNLNVALFNCLPAVPLDGGHVFRDILTGMFERIAPKQRAQKLASWIVMALAYTIFVSIVLMVVGPYIAAG